MNRKQMTEAHAIMNGGRDAMVEMLGSIKSRFGEEAFDFAADVCNMVDRHAAVFAAMMFALHAMRTAGLSEAEITERHTKNLMEELNDKLTDMIATHIAIVYYKRGESQSVGTGSDFAKALAPLLARPFETMTKARDTFMGDRHAPPA